MRSEMPKLIPGLFSDYGSMRSPEASREVKVLEKVLFGAKVRIVIDPEMPPDEMRVLSPMDDSILSEINDIKVLTPGHGFNSERSQRTENGGRP